MENNRLVKHKVYIQTENSKSKDTKFAYMTLEEIRLSNGLTLKEYYDKLESIILDLELKNKQLEAKLDKANNGFKKFINAFRKG